MFTQSARSNRSFGSVLSTFFVVIVTWLSVTDALGANAPSVFGNNLIVNGDAESAAGSTDGGPVPSIPGWNTHGTLLTVIEYGSSEFPSLSDPGPKKRGRNFFAGGQSASSKASQSIDLSSGALAIDTGKTKFSLSGWLGGYADQEDNAMLTVVFYDESETKIGSTVLDPVTAADRKNDTGLVYKDKTANVPAGTRSLRLTLVMTRTDGAYNDGYADDLALVLTAPPLTTTKTSLTASKTDVALGASVSLTALVTPSSGSTTPAGTVSFKEGTTILGTVTLNSAGQATFSTSSLAAGSDSITATYNASSTFSASTSTAVTVTVTAAATLTVSPASISFPQTAVGATSGTQALTLRNTGNVTATIRSLTLTGSQVDDFTLNNGCGTSLAAGSSCTAIIAFKPVSTGAKNARVSVADNTAGAPQTVPLTGTGGTPISGPKVSLSATSLAFADQAPNTLSAAKSVRLSNNGDATLTLSSITVSGSQADDFILSKTCGTSLAKGASCTLSITFKPVSTGAKAATVSVSDNANESPQSITLSGTGRTPSLTLSPNSLTFASQNVGTFSNPPQVVTVTNRGPAPLHDLTSTYTGARAFVIVDTCGKSLAAGASCELKVYFEPSSVGASSGILEFGSRSGLSQSLTMSGVGT